ncbi:uncharacterized protein PAC_14517 [Phialocephala subalpina]|uniref:BED-type domain-containing protein n=1 Tax=Phialocephala subalpina TaxID=576137 RepID=A0A1L7XHU5_9HELO|nr:uncharacterized protein PAC_14517 [Phialocephala subalpina]
MALVSVEHPPIFQLLDLTLPRFHTEADIQFQDFNFSPSISPRPSPSASPSPLFASPVSSSRSRSPSALPKRSWIWAHHAPNRRSFHAGSQSRWYCAYCPKSFKSISGTGKPMRHLEVAHGILRPTKRPDTTQFSASTLESTPAFLSRYSCLDSWDRDIDIEQFSPDTHPPSCTDSCGNHVRSATFSNDLDSWLDGLHSSDFDVPAFDTASLASSLSVDSVLEKHFASSDFSSESSVSYLDYGSDSSSRTPTKSASFSRAAKRSWIWQHHENFSGNDEGSVGPHWRCAYCWKVYRRSSGTGKAIKHLRDAHSFVC